MELTLISDEQTYITYCEAYVVKGETYLRIYFPLEQTESETSKSTYYVLGGLKTDTELKLEEHDNNENSTTSTQKPDAGLDINSGNSILHNEVDRYKLYYVVDSGVLGIVGFDDGISNSDILAMEDDLQLSGYSVDYVEINGARDIVIPTTIKGYNVYAIDGGEFNNCTSITSITIPSCVEVIESGAFNGCNINLIIYGDINSSAHLFAKENNIRFEQQ